MLRKLQDQLAWHLETAIRILRLTPLWVLLVPAAGALAIYELNRCSTIAPCLTKDNAEFISPIILAVGVVIGAWLAATRPHVYYKWQALFALALFLRELHFRGTNSGFYIALILLIWFASEFRDRMEPFISDRTVVTLLMAVLWTYFISKTFDRHYWDPVLTGRVEEDLFEENLEVEGHLIWVALVIVSIFRGGTRRMSPPPGGGHDTA